MTTQGFDPEGLRDAEILLTNGTYRGVALAYTPGEVPKVLVKARGKILEELMWCAQEQNIPLLESPQLTADLFTQLEPGREIPESFYRIVARCLALIQKNSPPTVEVKLIKAIGKAPETLKRRLRKRVREIADALEVSRITVTVGSDEIFKEIGNILPPYGKRLEIELGLPLAPIEYRVSPEGLSPNGFKIELRGTTYGEGTLGEEDAWGTVLGKLFEVVYREGWRLLGYRETEALLNNIKARHSSLYHALFPHKLTLGALRLVLRNLLREGISIRDLVLILETISEYVDQTEDPDELTEYVRGAFSRWLCNRYCDDKGRLNSLLLEPGTEKKLLDSLKKSSSAVWLDLDLDSSLKLLSSISKSLRATASQNVPVVILCSPRPRRFLRRLIEPSFPFLPVLSYAEIAPLTEVVTVGVLSI